MTHPSLHDRIKADMDRVMSEMQHQLDVAMFKPNPFLRAVTPPTTRQRLRWKVQRVQNYFVTIWRALRGDDLDTLSDGDY